MIRPERIRTRVPGRTAALRAIVGLGFVLAGCGGDGVVDPSASLPDTTETRAPLAVRDLRVTRADYTWLELAWESAGDSTSAVTEFFDLRYATEPVTDANWDGAGRYARVPAPGAVGATHACRVGGLRPGTEYHFAMKSGHTTGGPGPLSGPVSGAIKRFFAAPVPVPDIAGEIVFVHDMDGDGDTDVVTRRGLSDAGADLLLNDGAGRFLQAGHIAAELGNTGSADYAVADLDGDGRLDIACRDAGVSVVRNLGGGVFGAPERIVPIGVQQIAAGDFDGDGDVDLAVAWPYADILPAPISWIVNDGTGYAGGQAGLETRRVFPQANVAYLGSHDMDCDGRDDLIFFEYKEMSLNVLFSGGADEAWTLLGLPARMLATTCAPVDMNGDGLPDFAAGSGGTFYTRLNDGDRGFVTVPPINKNAPGNGPVIALDFDGDGVPDIVSGERRPWTTDQIVLGLNEGDGTFAGSAVYDDDGRLAFGAWRYLFALDADGDDDLDLLVATGDFAAPEIVLLRNDPEPLD